MKISRTLPPFGHAALLLLSAGGLYGLDPSSEGGQALNERLVAQQQPVYPRTYDSHPAFVETGFGHGFMVWHSFVPGAERIIGRTLGRPGDPPFADISAGTGILTPAELAGGPGGGLAAVWSSQLDGRWTLQGRRSVEGRWSAVERLSPPDADALQPALEPLGEDRYALAWSQWTGERFQLVWAPWTFDGIGAAIPFSDAANDAFRPQLIAGTDGSLFAVWDAYGRGTSAVYARQLLPEMGQIEKVSSSPDRCLKPRAARASDGSLVAAWVRATDVSAAADAIDQMHSIQAARRGADGWRLLTNEDGGDEAAWLTSGLLAKIEPQAIATGGYMGRRRDPMFVREGEALWLVWERKTPHEGVTSHALGELLGRRISSAGMEPAVSLKEGLVDYHVAHDAEVHEGRFTVMGSSLPRDGQRAYYMTTVVLADAKPAKTEPWPGWKRVELPLPEAEPKRHAVREDGREYHLFWMDSHVHSALSADAEGEPDEILFYARDRGRLDTVVMQENDFFNCPLTDYEYALGTFYSRVLSTDGSFVAMPGYEWTQRVPLEPSASRSEPRFWGKTYPNHRTIIYPRKGGPLVRYTDVGNDIGKLYEVVAANGGVMHTQHAEFDFKGAPGEVAIEVTAGWGLYFLNPRRIHATLNEGFRAGFVGTSDSHRRNPGLGGGLTGIYAAELTPDAILEAYRSRRVFATNGSRIALEARADGVLMGQDSTAGRSAMLTLFAAGSRPIRRATLLRDGAEVKVFTAEGNDTAVSFEHEVSESSPGTHWFYWRVEQEGVSEHYGGNVATAFGNMAWATPHWITFEP